MNSSTLKFPRLNLPLAKVTYLSVFGSYEWSPDRFALLNNARNISDAELSGSSVISLTQYKSRGVSSAYHLIAASSHVGDDESDIHVTIHYRREGFTKQRQNRLGLSEGEFLKLVSALGPPAEVQGSVIFRFEDRDSSQLWFPLPVSLTGKSPSDVIELRGVRGTKRMPQGVGIEYEFILDRPEQGGVALQLELNIAGSLSSETPRLVLNRAQSIARELVTDS